MCIRSMRVGAAAMDSAHVQLLVVCTAPAGAHIAVPPHGAENSDLCTYEG